MPEKRRQKARNPMALGVMLVFLFVTAITGVAFAEPPAQASEGEALFQQKCGACHTVGGGDLVGPDLQGVTGRRERAWLARWILTPDRMLASGDPIATELFNKYNKIPMPNLGLTDQQVEALIAYLESLEAGAAPPPPSAIPSLYFPTLIASLVALVGLTAVGFLAARKQVEVRW